MLLPLLLRATLHRIDHGGIFLDVIGLVGTAPVGGHLAASDDPGERCAARGAIDILRVNVEANLDGAVDRSHLDRPE